MPQRALFPGVNRHLKVFGLMALSSLAIMVGLLATVHSYAPGAAEAHRTRAGFTDRWDRTIQRWIQRGFVHEGGMQFWDAEFARNYPRSLPPPDQIRSETVYAWRNSTMSWILPAYWLQAAYSALGGRYSARLTALCNQAALAAAAAVLGYLCAMMALRMGQPGRHALPLGVAAAAVFQTHPLSLLAYWEAQPLAVLLVFCLVFLAQDCASDRALGAASRASQWLRMATSTAIVFCEPVTGGLFIASYLVVRTLLAESAPSPGDWMRILVVPALLVIAYLLWQQAMVRTHYASVVFVGSDIGFRTGLDGDATYYRDIFDTWLRPHLRGSWLSRLVDWHYLNAIGLLATAVLISLYREDRGLQGPVRLLVAAYGLYVPVALIFSQLVYIHPYYWNLCLLVPLTMATFCLAPAYLNERARHSGMPVLGALVLAVGYAVYNARAYRLVFPFEAPG